MPLYGLLRRLYHVASDNAQLMRIRRLAMSSPEPVRLTSCSRRVLFHTFRAWDDVHTHIELLLAKALQVRGHDVLLLFDGGALSFCTGPFSLTSEHVSSTELCRRCNFGITAARLLGVPHMTYGQVLSPEDIREMEAVLQSVKDPVTAVWFRGVEVSKHARDSVERYFLGAPFTAEAFRNVYFKELRVALSAVAAAGAVLLQWRPDILVTSHGCYSHWGSFYEYAKLKGVTSHLYGTSNYGLREIGLDVQSVDDVHRGYQTFLSHRYGRHLDPHEESALDKFLADRFQGKRGDVRLFHRSRPIDWAALNSDRSSYRRVFALFSNVPWDAGLNSVGTIFSSVYEWIEETIGYFQGRPEDRLIIKTHPAEMINGTMQTTFDRLMSRYRRLPDNIVVLPSDSNVTAYDLFELIDVGIVYNGTVGLEMAVKGKPVVTAARAFYANLGFTFDPGTRSEYFGLLERDLRSSPAMVDEARLFAYYYFLRSFVTFPLLAQVYGTRPRLSIEKGTELLPGAVRELDHICNYLVGVSGLA